MFVSPLLHSCRHPSLLHLSCSRAAMGGGAWCEFCRSVAEMISTRRDKKQVCRAHLWSLCCFLFSARFIPSVKRTGLFCHFPCNISAQVAEQGTRLAAMESVAAQQSCRWKRKAHIRWTTCQHRREHCRRGFREEKGYHLRAQIWQHREDWLSRKLEIKGWCPYGLETRVYGLKADEAH